MREFATIIIAYLDGETGAAEVLNDYLEERSKARAAEAADAAGRLRIVLRSLLPVREAELLACDFAEHVLPLTAGKGGSVSLEAGRSIAGKRLVIEGRLPPEQLNIKAEAALANWTPDNSPASRALWAAWAAAMADPCSTAAAAQAAGEGELAWQVTHTKQYLAKQNESSIP